MRDDPLRRVELSKQGPELLNCALWSVKRCCLRAAIMLGRAVGSRFCISRGIVQGKALSRHLSAKVNLPHVDVLIIGGAVVGSSVAYQLKLKQPNLKVAIVERDLNYTNSATTLSCASIRQQFSIKENIQLSNWSYKFLSTIGKRLKVKNEDAPDIQLKKRGYLFLCSNAGLPILEENVALQRSLGCKIAWFTPNDLQRHYPWLSVDGIAAGSIGMECEGHFDPWLLLTAFRRKCISMGVQYIEGEMKKISCNAAKLVTGVTIDTNGEKHKVGCDVLVNAGGPWAGAIADCVGIKLPVQPRKRYVYVLKAPKGPKSGDMPMLIDSSGVYCRPDGEGNVYLAGRSPVDGIEPSTDTLDVDYDFFDQHIWPILAERVPAFEQLKVQHSWAGMYDYNTVDQNAIIGAHPRYTNLYFANGFSGHGIQQSPAVGNAIAELIVDGKYTDIDLDRFSIERILRRKPLKEKNII